MEMLKKDSHKKLSKFKVLLVYPNIQMCEMMPYSIGLLTGILRREGFSVDLFDTTFYVDKVNEQYEAYHDYVQEFDWKEKGRIFKSDIVKDFPEVFRYTKVGPNVPSLAATSQDLADQTYIQMCADDECKIMFDIVGQECHGVTAIASNPWDAFEHIERVEHICKIVLSAS